MHPSPDPRIAALYKDCRDLALYIAEARREISQMRPEELKRVKLPRAGQELEAIVKATEEATHTIMTAAEEIMAADASAPAGYKTAVEDGCMRIFEACSFQDITGQRITKVVNTLTYIEERLTGLQKAWGPDLGDAPSDGTPEATGDAALLNGPSLAGEGVDQSDVDAMFDTPAKPAAANGAKSGQSDIDAMFD